MNRSRASETAESARMILIATSSPSSVRRARYTAPIPPSARGARISYRPSRICPVESTAQLNHVSVKSFQLPAPSFQLGLVWLPDRAEIRTTVTVPPDQL